MESYDDYCVNIIFVLRRLSSLQDLSGDTEEDLRALLHLGCNSSETRRTMCECHCPVKFSMVQELPAKEPRRRQPPPGPAKQQPGCAAKHNIVLQSTTWCCKAQIDCAAKHRLIVLQSTDWLCCKALCVVNPRCRSLLIIESKHSSSAAKMAGSFQEEQQRIKCQAKSWCQL